MSKFSDGLRKLRVSKGCRQKDIAKLLNITLRRYQDYEYDKTAPNYQSICILADFYGVRIDYLFNNISVERNDCMSIKADMIYDICRAVEYAKNVEKESGYKMGWYDASDIDEIEEFYDNLSNTKQKMFDSATDKVRNDKSIGDFFNQLLDLHENEFESTDDFMDTRREIMESIIDNAIPFFKGI